MQRSIRRVFDVGAFTGRAPGMSNRLALAPGHWEEFDPFLIMAEDKFNRPGGFRDHPHRGIQTVTLVLDGELRHADNRGNSGVLRAGDVQWMTAGKGIIHAELPHEASTVHSLQLWVNLPSSRKMVPSDYRDLRAAEAPVLEEGDATVRLISGELEGVAAGVQDESGVVYLDVVAPAGSHLSLPVPASHNGFLYMMEGAARFGAAGTPGRAGQVLWLNPPSRERGRSALEVRADAAARFILVTGEPLREPVVAYGPFVMNTPEEIVQAYADYRAGHFGGPTPAALEVR